MNVLLITTLSNRVAQTLNSLPWVRLRIVDCNQGMKDISVRIDSFLDEDIDLILTYRCPYILKKEQFLKPELGAYNIHPSLLPKYAGLNPWEEIFKNKEKISGVTIHRITELVDKGEIISQRKFAIETVDNILIARDKADRIAADMVNDFVGSLC